MDALQTAMRPVAAVLNRQIRAKAPARALCHELRDKTVAVRVRNTMLAMGFEFHAGEIVLATSCPEEPDVLITGPLPALLRLSRTGDADFIRSGAVELTGDVEAAENFQKLLAFARPDFEEELSHIVGDVAAHGIGNTLRTVAEWGRTARATIGQNIAEYLQEESRMLPGRYEADSFRRQVETLRDDVARFEARLRRLEQGPAGKEVR